MREPARNVAGYAATVISSFREIKPNPETDVVFIDNDLVFTEGLDFLNLDKKA